MNQKKIMKKLKIKPRTELKVISRLQKKSIDKIGLSKKMDYGKKVQLGKKIDLGKALDFGNELDFGKELEY
jgi:hypothetical protein